MTNQQIDWEEDSRAVIGDNSAALGIVGNLARRACALEDSIAELDKVLKEKKATLRDYLENSIVAALDEACIESFTLMDGSKITVREDLFASIPAKNRAEAAAWLQNNQLGALVKEDVIVHMDKGDSRADELRKLLYDAGFDNLEQAPSMNTGSIKSAIKEMLQDGKDVPLPLFGAYQRRAAKIKRST